MNGKLFGLAALVLAGCFAAAAVYINLAEHPARLALDDRGLLIHWHHSYPAAMRMQSTIVIVAGLLGLCAWWLSRDWRWAVGTALILANWPYTIAVMMPVNNQLLVLAAEHANADTRMLMEQWGILHAVRSGLGVSATLAFLWALRSRTFRRAADQGWCTPSKSGHS